MIWIYYLDLFGTFVFCISGVLTAIEKKFDLVGTLIIGFVTAIGGGTIRDLLIGRSPVGWLNDRNYLLAILVGFVIAYGFYKYVLKFKKSMFLFDTIGIGLFTIIGVQIGLEQGLRIENCLIMGVITACFGGVIRDVLANEIPLIFRKEIYASACFIGALIYIIMLRISPLESINVMVSIVTVLVIRYLSIKKGWALDFRNKKNLEKSE